MDQLGCFSRPAYQSRYWHVCAVVPVLAPEFENTTFYANKLFYVKGSKLMSWMVWETLAWARASPGQPH